MSLLIFVVFREKFNKSNNLSDLCSPFYFENLEFINANFNVTINCNMCVKSRSQ